MSNRLETLLERIPRHFAYEPTSNNYKLLNIVAQHSADNRTAMNTILEFWDVDTAEGVGLDRLGKDEGISRGRWDDEEYRKMIKIQCIVNLSEGDIDVMNQILDAYMGERFIGIEDGWKHIEPASILGRVKSQVGAFPQELIKRIKPAGVAFYWLIELGKYTLTLQHYRYNYPIYYEKCGELITEPILGVGVGATLKMGSHFYDYPLYYNSADTFNTDPVLGVGLESEIILRSKMSSAPLYYPTTNLFNTDMIAGNLVKLDGNIKHAFSSMAMPYPVCGNFMTGGVI